MRHSPPLTDMHATDARQLAGDALVAALRDSRARTWSLVGDLSDAQWLPPYQRGVNPVAWELAHLAWFAEFWTLRGPHARDADGHARAARPARHFGPDADLDSARRAHALRWSTPMPERAQLALLLERQLEDSLAAVADRGTAAAGSDDAHYFHRLALFHEDMHGEAFCWMRATLGYPAPPGVAPPVLVPGRPIPVRGGEIETGRRPDAPGFAFDNEMPARLHVLADYEIDATPVSAGAYAAFVDAGGYADPAFWPGAAGAWRAASNRAQPQRWRRDRHGEWQIRWFDRLLPLEHDAPAIHFSAFEAEAYCLWAGRRLPSAAEWEHAARAAGAGFRWGHGVWEWTADAFAPYPGFAAGPYREYSQPWFGNHRELRGGAFATHTRLHDPSYRNFFEPQRTDIFAGFRSVAA